MRFQNYLSQLLGRASQLAVGAVSRRRGYAIAPALAIQFVLLPFAAQANSPVSDSTTAPAAGSVAGAVNEPVMESVPESDSEAEMETGPNAPLNLSPEVIDQSPVLQRWLESVPDIQGDIRNDPSFTTRLQAGYTFFPSSDGTSGFIVAVDDVFLGRTPLTVSADYQQNFRGDRQAYGADLHYYLLPLGGYFNASPIVGYRHADSGDDYSIDGANLGVRLRLVPSRTGAADITLDQSWIVGDSEQLSITQLNFRYAVTQHLRLSTDLEWQSTADEGDSRVGVNFEWSL